MLELGRLHGMHTALALREAMDQIFNESFVRPWSMGSGSAGPAMDVYEQGDEYVVALAVPGLRPEQFDLTLEQSRLTIRGTLQSEQQGEQQRSYHLRERRFGNFARTVQLPSSVNAEQSQATLEHGILRIRIPKAEEARPKKISIKALTA